MLRFHEDNNEYCCAVWRFDGSKRLEAGAVYGICGENGLDPTLALRLCKLDPPGLVCCELTKLLGGIPTFKHESPYVATLTQAQEVLRQQIRTHGNPQWDIYKRLKFPAGVKGRLRGECAACSGSNIALCHGTVNIRKVRCRIFGQIYWVSS